jgi:hypothetical protein
MELLVVRAHTKATGAIRATISTADDFDDADCVIGVVGGGGCVLGFRFWRKRSQRSCSPADPTPDHAFDFASQRY